MQIPDRHRNIQGARALPKVAHRELPNDRYQPTHPTDDLNLIPASYPPGVTKSPLEPGNNARRQSMAALLAASLVGVAGIVFTGASAAQPTDDPPPSFTQMRAAAEQTNPTFANKPLVAKKPSDLGALNLLVHGMKIPDSQWTIKAEYRKGPKLSFRTTF